MTSLPNFNVWRHNWRKFAKNNIWILFPKMTLGDSRKMLPIWVKDIQSISITENDRLFTDFIFIFHSFKFRFKSFSFFYFVNHYCNKHQNNGSTKTRNYSNMLRRNRHGSRRFCGWGCRYLSCHYCIFRIVETGKAWEALTISCVRAAWLIKIELFLDFELFSINPEQWSSINPFCFILLCMTLWHWVWII